MKEAKLRSLNTVWPQIYNILGKGKLWRQSKENKSELGVWKDEWVQEKGNGKLSNIISDIRNLKVIFLTLKKGKLDKLKISNFYECFVIVESGSCVWLSATLWTVTYKAPPSMGLSRQEYWSGVPLPSPIMTYRYFNSSMSWTRDNCGAFELWCYRRLLGVPWTARRSH